MNKKEYKRKIFKKFKKIKIALQHVENNLILKQHVAIADSYIYHQNSINEINEFEL